MNTFSQTTRLLLCWVAGRFLFLLLLINATAQSFGAETNFAFRTARMETNGFFLQWDGGYPPFLLERNCGSSVSPVWVTEPSSPADNAFLANASTNLSLFRVRGTSQPPWGTYLGQWRLMEGEFGKYMARHRLKTIWDIYEPIGGAPRTSPSAYFQSLIIKLQYCENLDVITRIGSLSEFPNAIVQPRSNTLTATWRTGTNATRKDFTLRMVFPYSLSTPRSTMHISDPTITFSCVYAVPQFEIDADGSTSTSRTNEVSLVQLSETSDGYYPQVRPIKVSGGKSSVNSSLTIGMPLWQGSPPMIFKTPILVGWISTTLTGMSSSPFGLRSRFAQTYLPGHHNFVETLLLEPAMEPTLPAGTLEELKKSNIRYILATQPTAFPEQPVVLKVIGFDNTVRTLK